MSKYHQSPRLTTTLRSTPPIAVADLEPAIVRPLPRNGEKDSSQVPRTLNPGIAVRSSNRAIKAALVNTSPR